MSFVDDEDLDGVAGGEVADGCAQLADFVNAAVGGGVNLEHIYGGAGGDFPAGRALAAGPHRRAFLAVQGFRQGAGRGGVAHAARAGKVGGGGPPRRVFLAVRGFRQDARRGGLAHAARAGKDVGVRHLVLLEGVLEGADDGFLADDFVEGLRAVFARDYLIGHSAACLCCALARGPRNLSTPPPRPVPRPRDSGRSGSMPRPASAGLGIEGPDSGTSAAPARIRYRCFLPDLAGFSGSRRTEPEVGSGGHPSTRGLRAATRLRPLG